MDPLNIDASSLRYQDMIGVGGIGSGSFFELRGNHTLGREESRAGRFLDRRDYCKLHIIAHYVQTLLGPCFRTIPIGAVGDDDVGRRLLSEMAESGLGVSRVGVISGKPTLYSFCFVYPDGAGGNLTSDDSASSHVDADLVREAKDDFAAYGGKAVALAAPEVPLGARSELLRLGQTYQLFCAASFTTEELHDPRGREMLEGVDLVALNVDEAAAAAGLSGSEGVSPESVAESAVQRLSQLHPDMLISITAGSEGSWAWDGSALSHCGSCQAEVSSTAGAGDAHFAGIIVGLTAGLPLREAQQLGTLVAGLSVTSQHTINKEIGRDSLRTFSERCGLRLEDRVRSLLEA
jgi:sugar/nucleoside kinase (ribokinase family)